MSTTTLRAILGWFFFGDSYEGNLYNIFHLHCHHRPRSSFVLLWGDPMNKSDAQKAFSFHFKKAKVLPGEQRVFWVDLRHPTGTIREALATILICKKWTWAELPDGKRHLLGASAFFTRAGAERVKLAALYRVLRTKKVRDEFPGTYDRAKQQVAEYRATGRLN